MTHKKFQIPKWIFAGLLIIPVILSGCMPSVAPSGNQKGSDEFVKGGVVKGFPSLPLMPKARVLESYGNNGAFGASFISDDDLDKVVKFYDQSLKKLGWESSQHRQSETNYVFEVKNSAYRGSVIVNTAADGKKTVITIAVLAR